MTNLYKFIEKNNDEELNDLISKSTLNNDLSSVRKDNKKENKSIYTEDNELNSIISHFTNAIDKNISTKFSFMNNSEEYKLYSKKDENLLQKNQGIFLLSQTQEQLKKRFTNYILKVNEISESWIRPKRTFKSNIQIAFNNSFSFFSLRIQVLKKEISFYIERNPYRYNSNNTKESLNTFTISPTKANDRIYPSDNNIITDSEVQHTSKGVITEGRKYYENKKPSFPIIQNKPLHMNLTSNVDLSENEVENEIFNQEHEYKNFIIEKRDGKYNSVNPIMRSTDNIKTDIKLPKINNQKEKNLKEISIIFPQEISHQKKQDEILNQKTEFVNFYNNLLNERSYAYQNSYYLNNMKNSFPKHKRHHISNSLSMHNIISEFSNFNRDYVNKLMSPKFDYEVLEPNIYDYKRIERNRTNKSPKVDKSKY